MSTDNRGPSALKSPPPLAPPEPLRIDGVTEAQLDNGLRVLVVRRPTVPRVEIRLQVPVGQPGDCGDDARASLMARTLAAGSGRRSDVVLGRDLQRMGGRVTAFADIEQLAIGGAALSAHLEPFLELLGEVLVTPAFPDDEVERERGRMAREVQRARSQTGTLAREALLGRLYGDHPYGCCLPSAGMVSGVSPDSLRDFHRDRVRPRGAVLVLVGDVEPETALAAADRALGHWPDTGTVEGVSSPAALPPSGPSSGTSSSGTVLVDRPGSVQTTILMGGAAPALVDPDAASMQVTTTVLGGYSSSRLCLNLRERHGFTYGAECGIQRHLLASNVIVATDVATDATGPALAEIRAELGGLATDGIGPDEVQLVVRYLCGSLCLGTQSQTGLASYLASVVTAGLGVDHFVRYLAAMAGVGPAEVQRVAASYLAPGLLQTVLVGDAERVLPQLDPVDRVEVRESP